VAPPIQRKRYLIHQFGCRRAKNAHGFDRQEAHMGVARNPFASIVAIAMLGLVPAVGAQPASGKVSGVVRDASGAVVPGATVTLTNQATRATHTATTGADGSYSVSVPAGTYSASALLRGVGHQSLRDLKLESGATLTPTSPSLPSSPRRSRSPR
jgi:hypothetical protein